MTDPIDLADLAFWRQPPARREAAFARLRAREGLAFFPERRVPLLRKGSGFHAVARHADVVEASRNPKLFSSEPSVSTPEPPGWVKHVFGEALVNMDDPRHARLRRIVARAFTPKMLAKLEDDLRRAAAEIVDDVLAEGPGDFVRQVAARLPIRVICDMVGVPQRDRARVHRRVDVSTEYTGVRADLVRTLRMAAGNVYALVDLQRLVVRLGRERRGRPGDDLVSALVNADHDGERLTWRELGSFFTLLLVAGNETTRNALAYGLKLFTDSPDQREHLLGDYDARIKGAIEEIVRHATPIMQFRRTVTRDCELGGQELTRGDKVALLYVSANRDETVFKEPDVFDVTRDPNPHVGFGGPGPHFCLGANLARREMTVMFRELFTRLPDIRSAGEPVLLESNFDNGVTRLPYTF
ncbi:cytochrome P450 [Rhizohabitans arisaemae]|uniref:cytochrome P450 n=1 Tax=Rhizohabitans arisaemae TaxID=2720610 RepID=UPI0024B1832B|nr:cytochrome P450 [Rhizohabitans arisaemae]